ncbi:MAG: acetate--CoA ligase [Deltaproteobacteria bacterium]|nr:MAG: acetate--CoA ligase [Deltaproteobacteria bacterium]
MAEDITSTLKEERRFPPPAEFSGRARVRSMEEYEALYRRAEEDPEGFWAERAQELLTWDQPWEQVLDWQPPRARWFVGGRLNASVNCLDRHVATWRRNKAAIIWEGEPGEVRTLTYLQLWREVCRFANVLRKAGCEAGDRVVLYMPMVPELAVAMLACARLGVTHSIVFGGFSASAIRDRVNDAGAKVVVTADGGWRRGGIVPLKDSVDAALEGDACPSVEGVIVLRRTGQKVAMEPGRDIWWHELMETVDATCPPVSVDSEHPLFILYTSGTTGKPKGVVHSTGGYLLGTAWTSRMVFDLREEDTYWCTADIGWITGHSYIVYGPLANGATTVMYEGAPNWPEPDRFWDIIERHRVNIFYTAPTAIRAFIRWGDRWPLKHDLSSLRLLGTVGEPINPEAWIWYHRVIGKARCPIVDTWWQTETGAIMISPLPGATPLVPGSATRPLPGVIADVVDGDGQPVDGDQGGYLVIRKPWPSMIRGVWGDPERFEKTYFSQVPGTYFAGDGVRQDAEGNFWIMGRIDDVINVSGHRLGTMEIESALVSHPAVAEAAVVGRPDDLKGQAIVAFVSLTGDSDPSPALGETLRAHVAAEIGALARPEEVRFTDALPKTRSGKIMRRLLQDIAANRDTRGDTTTLEDATVLDRLRKKWDER